MPAVSAQSNPANTKRILIANKKIDLQKIRAKRALASQNTSAPAQKSSVPAFAVLGDATTTPSSPPDCTQSACLALTFDDGPNAVTTPQVMATLEQHKIPATFFVIGSHIAGQEQLLQRMNADGDEIGNHSWSHPNLTTLYPGQVAQQVAMTQAAITAAGVPAPTLFRPPYGAINTMVRSIIPLPLLLWNEDPKDWQANNAAQVVASVDINAKPGGIVDMHDIYRSTADALPQIVTDLTRRGFHFVTVSQLLGLQADSRGVFYGHAASQ